MPCARIFLILEGAGDVRGATYDVGSDLSAGNSVHLDHGGGCGEGWRLRGGICGGA